MPDLTIVAHITAKSDKIDLIKTELEKLIEPTRAEQGCRQYDLHQDNDNPAHFMFYENWESRELWLDHLDSQHIKDYTVAADGAIEDFSVQEMIVIA